MNYSSFAFVLAIALIPSVHAQGRGEPGKSIGSVAVRGNLIVMTLDEGVLGKESLFDLARRTVRYTPKARHTAWRTHLSSGLRFRPRTDR